MDLLLFLFLAFLIYMMSAAIMGWFPFLHDEDDEDDEDDDFDDRLDAYEDSMDEDDIAMVNFGDLCLRADEINMVTKSATGQTVISERFRDERHLTDMKYEDVIKLLEDAGIDIISKTEAQQD